MNYRARTRPMLRRACQMAALSALLVPAVAGTATAQAAKAPVVTKVAPKNVFVGQTLTLRGRNFRTGIAKNTVAFKRKGAKVVLVRADKSTKKMLKVKLPKRLEKILAVVNGTPVATRLQLRVLTTRFGRGYTSRAMSPIVGPEKPPAPPRPPVADPNADCDGDGTVNRIDADDDNDLLSDALEQSLKLDGCKADTDGDAIEDGYEYQSARDLNDDEHQEPNTYLPYPEKRPYPNALDKTDGGTDHDGDTLTLKDEYDLWRYTIKAGAPRTLTPLTYSAGEQFSLSHRIGGTGRREPTQPASPYGRQDAFMNWASGAGYAMVSIVDLGAVALDDPYLSIPDRFGARTLYDVRDMDRSHGVTGRELTYYDLDQNAWLDDAERDEDADGLPNQWESTGCLTRGYWDGLYDKETPYYLGYAPVRLDDPDTDGDGVRDGADDQDHDDVPNVMECGRRLALGETFTPADRSWQGFVNPFNPCLPHPRSRTCKQYVDIGAGGAWAPFNPDDKYYLILN